MTDERPDGSSLPWEPTIEVRGLRRTFGARTVLDGVDFTVHAGSVTGFLGPNGAGKSTTMRIIVGLDRPTAGVALIRGVPYRKLADPGRQIGTLIDSSGFHPGRTARQHLLILSEMLGTRSGRVDHVLDEVGLLADAGRRVGEYSLGMTRRLGLASAMLGEPDILILDEPSNGLDPAGIRWLRDRLRSFATAGGTVLVSSHVLGEIAQVADKIIVIDHGRIIADSTVAAFTIDSVVIARSADSTRLASVLRERGGSVEQHGDMLDIVGIAQDDVGLAAHAAGIPLFALTSRAQTLEERFLRLTEEVGDRVPS